MVQEKQLDIDEVIQLTQIREVRDFFALKIEKLSAGCLPVARMFIDGMFEVALPYLAEEEELKEAGAYLERLSHGRGNRDTDELRNLFPYRSIFRLDSILMRGVILSFKFNY